jgi:hypothetical protein
LRLYRQIADASQAGLLYAYRSEVSIVFERYTEGSRRSIFFGRYEASAAGSKWIEPAHLVLGIAREDRGIAGRIRDLEALREELVPATPGPPASTSVDLPMSIGSKRALETGAEYASRLQHRSITPLHLLLGLLEADAKVAEALGSRGFSSQGIQAELFGRSSPQPGDTRAERAALHAAIEALPDAALDRVSAMLHGLGGPEMHALPAGFRGTAAGGGGVSNTGGPVAGRRSSSRLEPDGSLVVESHHAIGAHEIRVVERLRFDAGRHTISYTHEVTGPGGERHQHSAEFPVAGDGGAERNRQPGS